MLISALTVTQQQEISVCVMSPGFRHIIESLKSEAHALASNSILEAITLNTDALVAGGAKNMTQPVNEAVREAAQMIMVLNFLSNHIAKIQSQ